MPVRTPMPTVSTEVNSEAPLKFACMIIWRGPASSSTRAVSPVWVACCHSSLISARMRSVKPGMGLAVTSVHRKAPRVFPTAP
jgi:hypothetical protein